MSQDNIVIVGSARTAMGNFQGSLSALSAPELGATAIKAAFEQSKINPADISEVIMGCVLSAGLGQAPARQASIGAGLPNHIPATTVNKMCGSGMKAVMLAYDQLFARPEEIFVAGGLESMTNAPYLLPKARGGYRLGHGTVVDHMFFDGLEDAYEKGCLMGVFAENTAAKYGFSRQQQDDYAIRSLERAQQAIKDGRFKDEIAKVAIAGRAGTTYVDTDEAPGAAKIDKIPQLKPAFRKDGTVTAANSSSISDGGAALILMRESTAKKKGLKPLAKILGHTSHAHEPAWFTTAPVGAMQKLMQKVGWTNKDVDLYEINEAFAVVTMAALADLSLDASKVNVHGGACALGHPIGASGARILVTLLSALRQYEKQRGIASLCIGGGEAVAVAVELV